MIGFSTLNSSGWEVSSKNRKITLKLKHKIIANNFFVIRDLIKKGHGIGHLPKFLCQSQIAVPHQKKISRKVRTFMDFAARRFAELF